MEDLIDTPRTILALRGVQLQQIVGRLFSQVNELVTTHGVRKKNCMYLLSQEN
jgi:hypothetical protein